MTLERTLSIIKPDGVAKNIVGEVISRFEKDGLRVAAAKMLLLSEAQVASFYAEHKGQPFFDGLLAFMSSATAYISSFKRS